MNFSRLITLGGIYIVEGIIMKTLGAWFLMNGPEFS